MRMSKLYLAASAAALVLASVGAPARAALLPIASTIAGPGTAYPNPLAGTTILANTGLEPYFASLNGDTINGTVQEWVVTNYASNPFGANRDTFVYQVTLTSGANSVGTAPVLERLAGSGFDTIFQTDVGTSNASGTVLPSSIDRSTNGNVVGFNFFPNPNIQVGQTSVLLIVNTDATGFRAATITVQDGVAANQNGFGPIVPAAVPEPGTMAAAMIGLACVGGHTWFRRRRA